MSQPTGSQIAELRRPAKGERRTKQFGDSTTLSATAHNFVPTGDDAPRAHRGDTTATTNGTGSKARNRNRRGQRRGQGARSDRPPPRDRVDDVRAAHDVSVEAGVSRAQTRTLVDDVKEAETITERLQQSLSRNVYECCICCDIIKRHQPVFEDQHCWAVFHLACVSKWAKRALSPESGPPSGSWRCPACNSPNTALPETYTCWCTKEIQPEVSRTSPHSCGQTCGKARGGDCPHPCSLACHPGPCSPCTNLGPEQSCFCGKNSTQRRCVDTDYALGAWSCREVCGEIMPCDEHACERTCHPGLCGACGVLEEKTCFCGRETRSVACSEQKEARDGVAAEGRPIVGSWQCPHRCEKTFDCGIHKCTKPCHTKTVIQASACPLSPSLVTTCHCGQSRLRDLLEEPRSVCTDPVPACSKVCSKVLPCGHTCRAQCHPGPCGECSVELDILCHCGSSRVSTTCQDMQLGLQPSCERVCKASLSCARHICMNRCCSGHQASQARIARRPKARQAAQLAARYEEIEAEHLCTKSCGRALSCGNHSCGVLCHSGPCPSCLVASFDDLTCHCGRTSIPAPVACGTVPPACKYLCTRAPACGHPSVPHNCHLDDEACPRCPYLVEKSCMCGKQRVKNQSCWQTSVSCGQICDTPLSCGSHRCLKRCHLPEECESPCRQVCGKTRLGCGHPCKETCHTAACPEDPDHPCKASIMAVCACGNTKMAVRCNSQDADATNQANRFLKCTDFCAITARNKKLSAALGVPATDPLKPVSSAVYEESTLAYYRDNRIWCSTIEQAFRTFLSSPDRVKNFKPMRAELRRFVHELAEVHGMTSESMDEEPKRSVQIQKTANTAPPQKSLAQSSLLRTNATTTTTTTVEAERKKTSHGQAYNAMVLVGLRFGATEEELESVLHDTLHPTDSPLTIDVRVTEDGEFGYLVPRDGELGTEQVESLLVRLKGSLRQVMRGGGTNNNHHNNKTTDVADAVELCWIDRHGEMAYRELSARKGANKSSSSSVASFPRKGAAGLAAAAATRNTFDALSSADEHD